MTVIFFPQRWTIESGSAAPHLATDKHNQNTTFFKLTQTSALRLYRVPRTSQLLARLDPDLDGSVQSGPHSGNRGVVTHTPGTRSGRPQLRPTALEALGTRVPPDGPRADVLAIPPWEVPNWGRQLALMGVTNPQDCRRFVEDLYQSPAYSNASITCVAGTISDKDRPNNQLVGYDHGFL